jgi:tetratricopeptide (TPR) repeat protein
MKYFDLIESYQSGTMSETEALAFEQDLADRPELKKEYDDYLLAKQISGALAYEEAKRRIAGLQKSALQVSRRSGPVVQLLRIAAVLLVLVVFGFLFGQVRYTDTALADRHFRSTSMHMRSPQADGAAQLIDKGAYEDAIALLQQANPEDPFSRSLLAEALAKAKRHDEAIEVYRELAADQQNINRDGAEFALALLYLQTHSDQAAKDLISRIAASEDHDYRYEARKLEAELGSFWRRFVF